MDARTWMERIVRLWEALDKAVADTPEEVLTDEERALAESAVSTTC